MLLREQINFDFVVWLLSGEKSVEGVERDSEATSVSEREASEETSSCDTKVHAGSGQSSGSRESSSREDDRTGTSCSKAFR